jgi:transcriptional regulator with XRE-family HTH domain
MRNKLGKLVRENRLNAGLTQAEYAERLKISTVTLSKVENGTRVGASVIRTLAGTLRLSVRTVREYMTSYENNE